MKKLAVICIIGVLLSACQKQKNVDELEQFKGKWKLKYFVLSDHGNSISAYDPKPLYSSIEGIECEFLNDGYFTFTSDKFGKERFRIKSFVNKKDILYFTSSTTHITTEGYSLTLFNKTGKKFLFVLALDPFTNRLYTEIWHKGIPYFNARMGVKLIYLGAYEKY